MLVYTGVRISEALNIHFAHIDLSSHAIRIRSLKKRKDKEGRPRVIFRSIPVPTVLIDMLYMVYGLRETQAKGKRTELDARVFPIG